MLTTRYKQVFNRGTEPIGRWLARCGATPNGITLLGFILGAAACGWYLAARHTVAFGIMIVLCGLFDSLDGAVARVTGRTTKFGSYLDAVLDRYFEAMVAITVAYATGYWLPCMWTLSGAMITSYTKARAALEIPVSNTEWPDAFERTERDVIFVGGLVAAAVWPVRLGGQDLFWWTAVLLGAATHATAVQRILRARRLILQRQ